MIRYGYVYITTNSVNNVIYVGQKRGTSFDENYLGSGVKISQAIRWIGANKFKSSLLEWCQSKRDLDLSESDIIAIFKFMGAKMYNVSPGKRRSWGPEDYKAKHCSFDEDEEAAKIEKNRLNMIEIVEMMRKLRNLG